MPTKRKVGNLRCLQKKSCFLVNFHFEFFMPFIVPFYSPSSNLHVSLVNRIFQNQLFEFQAGSVITFCLQRTVNFKKIPIRTVIHKTLEKKNFVTF